MKLIVFEGTDGSGKSTLIRGFMAYLGSVGLSCQLIDKDSRELFQEITNIYKYKDVTPELEVLLRASREFAKSGTIDHDVDFCLVDRGILSLATTMETYGLSLSKFEFLFDMLKRQYGDYTTVYCRVPYNVARSRVTSRAKEPGYILSKKEAKGYEYNQKVFEILEELKSRKDLVGNCLIPVDTHKMDAPRALDFLIRQIFGKK